MPYPCSLILAKSRNTFTPLSTAEVSAAKRQRAKQQANSETKRASSNTTRISNPLFDGIRKRPAIR
eukprot:1588160-Amphidinium_carterae.2